MTALIADEATLAFLRQAQGMAEIRDRAGNVIGVFAPACPPNGGKLAGSLIDPAEIARRKKETAKGYTTRQVFEHLLSLTEDAEERSHLQKLIAEVAERDACAAP